MKGNEMLAIFAISALLVSVTGTNFVFADESSDKSEDRKEKELKEKIDQVNQKKKELRQEYKIKLEEKRKVLADYRKELKEKYDDLKNEFKEKYAQLRISSISDVDDDSEGEIESEIKHNELRLLKHEYREQIKKLKLEAKQHFDELKHDLKAQETDRKNKIHEKINELKEKYKNKIKQHDHADVSDLDSYHTEYEGKKIEICHRPPGNTDNAHTISISVNALSAHLGHGDYMDDCPENGNDETDEDFEITVKAETLGEQSEVKIKLEFLTENTDEDSIINEIIENFALTSEEADKVLKIEENDDNELEEKFEIKIEEGTESTEVEIELRFILDTIDRQMIIDAIVQETQLTVEQIKGILEIDYNEENQEGETILVELKEELGISQQ